MLIQWQALLCMPIASPAIRRQNAKEHTSKEEAERGEPELSPLSKLVVRSREWPPKEP